jgi:hypothetical protein
MTIPPVFGKSKIGLLRGEEEPRNRSSRRSSGQDLTFTIEGDATVFLQPPSFNVLYVQPPRIEVLQTPLVQGLVQTWEETIDLLRPLLRFGFPETSLKTKCPYYE